MAVPTHFPTTPVCSLLPYLSSLMLMSIPFVLRSRAICVTGFAPIHWGLACSALNSQRWWPCLSHNPYSQWFKDKEEESLLMVWPVWCVPSACYHRDCELMTALTVPHVNCLRCFLYIWHTCMAHMYDTHERWDCFLHSDPIKEITYPFIFTSFYCVLILYMSLLNGN